ncbi:hypothetical protein LPJ61_003550 [Coemansia biformis]|uniref:RNI-like protein n=1 Tax=Coemansia biformis TaxID=1286918 RepID=A0A9W8CXK9_9FUNG|nr:hypothetical protein LPJ61_003550 [Coemansia biformis]
MDGTSPAAAAVIERVLSYLDSKTAATCKTLNRPWYALATIQSARNIDCHILQLPLRIAHYRRKGLLRSARGLTIDVSFVEGYLSPAAYERRIRDAAGLLQDSHMPVCHLKLHAPGAHSALTNDEIHYGTMALGHLMRALPGLTSLDLSDCPALLLAPPSDVHLASLRQLRQLSWLSLGSNDMTSATVLRRMVAANARTLVKLNGKGDVTDQTLRLLCAAPNFQQLDASGSSISDDGLLALVRSRGSSLRELTLSDCARLTRQSIAQLTPKLLPRLGSLDLYNVLVTTDTYQCLFNAQTSWPYLRDLKLKAAIPRASPRQDSLANDDILEAIGRNCPRLVSLKLFGCHGTTDSGLSAVLGNLGYLRELVVMHQPTDPLDQEDDAGSAVAQSTVTHTPSGSSSGANVSTAAAAAENDLLSSLPSISDIWASIPALPSNGLPQHGANTHHSVQSPPSTAPNSPCPADTAGGATSGQRVFTSGALRNGVRSQRFNLLNLDMTYDSVCAEHLAKLSHLHTLCGRMITRHAKSLIENQFPKCKMMVWNID